MFQQTGTNVSESPGGGNSFRATCQRLDASSMTLSQTVSLALSHLEERYVLSAAWETECLPYLKNLYTTFPVFKEVYSISKNTVNSKFLSSSALLAATF